MLTWGCLCFCNSSRFGTCRPPKEGTGLISHLPPPLNQPVETHSLPSKPSTPRVFEGQNIKEPPTETKAAEDQFVFARVLASIRLLRSA